MAGQSCSPTPAASLGWMPTAAKMPAMCPWPARAPPALVGRGRADGDDLDNAGGRPLGPAPRPSRRGAGLSSRCGVRVDQRSADSWLDRFESLLSVGRMSTGLSAEAHPDSRPARGGNR